MSSEDFYARLPVLNDFPGVCDLSGYRSLPADWEIVVADVQDSTGAIRAGQYKAVNILGVSVITALVNIAKPVAIPYIFGGDGASLCIPRRLSPAARRALCAVRVLAHGQFGLRLRAGIVPLHAVRQAGHRVLVARHRVSKHYVQAAFAGGGIEYAESLIKSEEEGAPYRVADPEADTQADFSGLECRWESVPSQRGEIISLIVKALAPSIEDQAAFYNEIIEEVRRIYGDDDQCRPVYVGGLRATYSARKLRFETAVRTFARGRAAYFLHLAQILVQNVIGWMLMTFRLNIGGVPWGNYKPDLVVNTDFRKFDGVLRQVLSGTAAQRERLAAYLEGRCRRGECAYGIHASPSALITCLISRRDGEHFHFVDGSDGGYATAAEALKAQLKAMP